MRISDWSSDVFSSDLDPGNEGGVILKARIAVRKGAPRDALAVLAPYGAARPDTVGVAMTRLEVYRAMRDAAGMREQFARLRRLATDNLDLRDRKSTRLNSSH